jgi:hypothetical protein
MKGDIEGQIENKSIDSETDKPFHDAMTPPHSESDSDDYLSEPDITDNLILQLKENISRNSIAIAEMKITNTGSEKALDSPRYSCSSTPRSVSGASDTSDTSDTSGTEPNIETNKNAANITQEKKKKKKNIAPRYVYAGIFHEDITDGGDGWTNIKRYRFQKCLWKLKYNRIVSTFYLNDLRKKERKWSWMIIVISTFTSGLTVANNVSSEPFNHYSTLINASLTISSMSTSLIAAWIKKQMFIEKINEIDKYLLNINSLCEELEVQFSLLNNDRTDYQDFKKKYIPEITKFLTTNPIIAPEDWKGCIKEITMKYPELVDPDNTEDNKLWPWYGDLVFEIDDNLVETHVRKPTTFMEHFKTTNTDRLRSSCCGKRTLSNVY